MAAIVVARDLAKTFRRGTEDVHALRGLSFEIQPGEFVAVVGPSGSGKTTLLNLLGCLDVPTAGALSIEGSETQGLAERHLTRLRRERIGFVFQNFCLIPTLTVEENVRLPGLFSRRQVAKRAAELLARVGLEARRHHRPHELSGGEMQRAAVARALINEPRLLLADEPTGNLDSATGDTVIALLRELNQQGLTLVVVTHNDRLASAASRRIRLHDGRIVADESLPGSNA